jgi:sulfotransferase
MKKTFHVLSGIPRSGSTVLAAILNQNPTMHISTTSGLVQALDSVANTWANESLLSKNDPSRTVLAQTMRGIIDAFYEKIDTPIVIDKSRGWPIPIIIQSMNQVLGRDLKIIATVRPVYECAASFVRLVKPNDLEEFINDGQFINHLKSAYITLQEGFNVLPENFLFIEYKNVFISF